MCLLFNLSKYIIIPLLTEWLQGRELVIFDTAFTNHEERNTMFVIIECHRKPFQASIFSVFSFNQSSHLMFKFAKARGYHLAEYTLQMKTKTLESFKSEIGINDRSLKTKFAYLKDIKSIEVNAHNGKETQLVSRLLQCLPQVESLKANGCNIFAKVGQYCKHLTHLDVGQFDRALHLDEVFRHCKVLTDFSWIDDSINRDRVYSSMVVHGRSLQKLKLHSSPRCAMMLGLHGPNEKLNNFTNTCPGRKALNALLWYRGAGLTKLKLTDRNEIVSYFGVKGIGAACPHLTDISLNLGTSDALCTIFKNVKRLKNFAIGEYCGKSLTLLAKVPTLELLHLPIVRGMSFESLLFRWDNLVVLSTHCCEHTPLLLRHCPKLRELILLSSYGWQEYNKWLEKLIPELAFIQVLELLANETIPATALRAIVAHCLMLTDLYCRYPSRVTTEAYCSWKVHPNREQQYP